MKNRKLGVLQEMAVSVRIFYLTPSSVDALLLLPCALAGGSLQPTIPYANGAKTAFAEKMTGARLIRPGV
jgi:hypothetical protein